MAKLNVKTKNTTPVPKTHEGGKAARINNEQMLRRSVLACLLWENTFYEDGISITDRISNLIPTVDPQKVAQLAIDARHQYNLRHIPMFIAREMAKHKTHKGYVSNVLTNIIVRADELAEFLSIYWKNGKCPISAQVKKGLRKAFSKFNEYALAKYNRDNAVTLRDVLFLVHPKPKDSDQDKLWKKLIGNYCEHCWKPNFAHKEFAKKRPKNYSGPTDGCSSFSEAKLAIPDTWETELSSKGKEAKASIFERLIVENKLGALAYLRNLRGMTEAGVKEKVIREGLLKMKTDRVLPFRFITAARYAPKFEPELEKAMLKSLSEIGKLPGKTVLLVDVSGSMDWKLSDKSELKRLDAANGIAIIAREICETVSIYSFSNTVAAVPPRSGFALSDAIVRSQAHSGTYLAGAIKTINSKEDYDRIIVFTDEQSHDGCSSPLKGSKAYMINVSSNQYGVGYGEWINITGFSEATIRYIQEIERY